MTIHRCGKHFFGGLIGRPATCIADLPHSHFPPEAPTATSPTHSPTHPFTHSPIHSLAHSPTCPFSHPPTTLLPLQLTPHPPVYTLPSGIAENGQGPGRRVRCHTEAWRMDASLGACQTARARWSRQQGTFHHCDARCHTRARGEWPWFELLLAQAAQDPLHAKVKEYGHATCPSCQTCWVLSW